MKQNDPYLDKLLSIKEELDQSNQRLEALENGYVLSCDDVDSYLMERRNNSATINDFLTEEQIAALNKDFNESLNKGVECDKLDYALAAASGVLCGLIDILFIKSPHEGLIGKGVDSLFENKIIECSNKLKNCEYKAKMQSGVTAEFKEITNIKSAIGYLEERFPVPYDQKNTQEIKKSLIGEFEETVSHLSPKNHHAKSLSHYPDIFGLISSICNQITNTSTFLDNEHGRILITNRGENGFELQGSDLKSCIYCGFVNWLFHCISDVAGSSGGKGNGQGLPIPFIEFFQFCNFGKIANEKGQWQTISTVFTKVYENGYDARHHLACSMPVILNDLITYSIFVVKEHFYNKKDWGMILSDEDLKQKANRMVTVSIGTMCVVDLGEAAITSFGDPVTFLSHLNLAAWSKLGLQCVKELQVISHQEMDNINRITKEVEDEWDSLLLRSKELIKE